MMTIADVFLIACFGFTCYQIGQIVQIRKQIKSLTERK